MLLVGYDNQSRNYRLYDPESKKITVHRNVHFNKTLKQKSTISIGDYKNYFKQDDTKNEEVLTESNDNSENEDSANETNRTSSSNQIAKTSEDLSESSRNSISNRINKHSG